MEEFNRAFFKTDPVMNKLFLLIKSKHQVADHTAKVLRKNRHIKDFCEIARHFVFLPSKNGPDMFIHYDVSSWYHKHGAQVRIDSIGVYDNFMEYEKARTSGLHNAPNKDIPNIN